MNSLPAAISASYPTFATSLSMISGFAADRAASVLSCRKDEIQEDRWVGFTQSGFVRWSEGYSLGVTLYGWAS